MTTGKISQKCRIIITIIIFIIIITINVIIIAQPQMAFYINLKLHWKFCSGPSCIHWL